MMPSSEDHEATVERSITAGEPEAAAAAPTSPILSDISSESEGKPVRDKLKETRIDGKGSPDIVTSSEGPAKDTSNGSVQSTDQSASESGSEHWRLRRKRSREDFEKDEDADAQPNKPHGKNERHMRKKSRDVTKGAEVASKALMSSVAPIAEAMDEQTTSPKKDMSKPASPKSTSVGASPKHKRTRDQAEGAGTETVEVPAAPFANGKSMGAENDERDSKRLRDKTISSDTSEGLGSITKIPPGSGFANTSASSPFATMSAKSNISSNKSEPLPQTSDAKFKASGFGGFASSTASPFGGLGGASSGSPFAAADSSKLNSFAGSKSLTPGGSTFAGFSNTGKSAFGNSNFGVSLSGGFGSALGNKPLGSGLTSFASSSGIGGEITGISKDDTPFGTPAIKKPDVEGSDAGEDDEEDAENDENSEERQSSQPLLLQQPHETGEENESTLWTGRAKLYLMAGTGATRGWKERGAGLLKLNLTLDEPKKARFVLRADGTHRLLLNASVGKEMSFGGVGGGAGSERGAAPKDGRLVFSVPEEGGGLEMHLLKLRSENAVKLWEEVTRVQKQDL